MGASLGACLSGPAGPPSDGRAQPVSPAAACPPSRAPPPPVPRPVPDGAPRLDARALADLISRIRPWTEIAAIALICLPARYRHALRCVLLFVALPALQFWLRWLVPQLEMAVLAHNGQATSHARPRRAARYWTRAFLLLTALTRVAGCACER